MHSSVEILTLPVQNLPSFQPICSSFRATPQHFPRTWALPLHVHKHYSARQLNYFQQNHARQSFTGRGLLYLLVWVSLVTINEPSSQQQQQKKEWFALQWAKPWWTKRGPPRRYSTWKASFLHLHNDKNAHPHLQRNTHTHRDRERDTQWEHGEDTRVTQTTTVKHRT